MNRLVYVAGFGNSYASSQEVGQSIQDYLNYDDFKAFDLGYALANQDEVRRAANEADDALSHSAGALALVGAYPNALHFFNAPLPTTRRQLVSVSIDRMRHEQDPYLTEEQLLKASQQKGSDREFFAHPIRNLGPLVSGRISRFHGIDAAIAAQNSGIHTGMAYSSGDRLFQPEIVDLARAKSNGVQVALIPGLHGELVSHTERALFNYFATRTI